MRSTVSVPWLDEPRTMNEIHHATKQMKSAALTIQVQSFSRYLRSWPMYSYPL